jgi:hypothetical protein
MALVLDDSAIGCVEEVGGGAVEIWMQVVVSWNCSDGDLGI